MCLLECLVTIFHTINIFVSLLEFKDYQWSTQFVIFSVSRWPQKYLFLFFFSNNTARRKIKWDVFNWVTILMISFSSQFRSDSQFFWVFCVVNIWIMGIRFFYDRFTVQFSLISFLFVFNTTKFVRKCLIQSTNFSSFFSL